MSRDRRAEIRWGVVLGLAVLLAIGIFLHLPGLNGPWYWDWPWRRLDAAQIVPGMLAAAIPFAAAQFYFSAGKLGIRSALILLALGGLLALIEQRNLISLPSPPSTGESGEPDYYLEDATLTRFDATGTAYQRLETPRLTHTPTDDVTRLQAPDARLVDDRGRVWLASADTGRLGANANPLKLSGNAQLQAPEQGWKINSEVLIYDAETGHAWSESEAVLRKFQQRVRGCSTIKINEKIFY